MKDLTLRHGQQVFIKDDKTFVKGICRVTKKPVEIGPIDHKALIEWLGDSIIQDTNLMELSAEDREFLISGYSAEGWDAMFGPEDAE